MISCIWYGLLSAASAASDTTDCAISHMEGMSSAATAPAADPLIGGGGGTGDGELFAGSSGDGERGEKASGGCNVHRSVTGLSSGSASKFADARGGCAGSSASYRRKKRSHI